MRAGRPRRRRRPGLVLVGWIVVQLAIIRSFSPFQPVCLAVGYLFWRAGRAGRVEDFGPTNEDRSHLPGGPPRFVRCS